MSNMSNLSDLLLFGNNLTGPIPSFGAANTNLTNLQLNDNMLSGGLPESLSDIPNPGLLTFHNNNLGGCFEASLMDLCNGTTSGTGNNTVSDGNSFAATWDDFCATGAGACTVNTDDVLKSIVSISPNPSDGLCYMQIGDSASYNVEVYDITGKAILRGMQISGEGTLDLSDEESGLYLVRVGDELRSAFFRVLKI